MPHSKLLYIIVHKLMKNGDCVWNSDEYDAI